ncbi:MAG TPA: hypothetical protein PLV52_07690, partial [Candidatus Omnitrophota bacterium]|nr:hypothetical protein [Candidatus Omnitrophota bacterium]
SAHYSHRIKACLQAVVLLQAIPGAVKIVSWKYTKTADYYKGSKRYFKGKIWIAFCLPRAA